MKISDLLIKDRINLDVQSSDKTGIIRELAKLHEKTGVLNDYEGYVNALMAREAQSSTGIGEGIAIPHAKTEFVKNQIETMIKYEIFIERENKQIEKFKKLEHMYIPENIDYDEIKGISNIARAGLEEVRPLSIGEATRISGVTSNDITLIIAHMNDK